MFDNDVFLNIIDEMAVSVSEIVSNFFAFYKKRCDKRACVIFVVVLFPALTEVKKFHIMSERVSSRVL